MCVCWWFMTIEDGYSRAGEKGEDRGRQRDRQTEKKAKGGIYQARMEEEGNQESDRDQQEEVDNVEEA